MFMGKHSVAGGASVFLIEKGRRVTGGNGGNREILHLAFLCYISSCCFCVVRTLRIGEKSVDIEITAL
jgi:hypothetical protein